MSGILDEVIEKISKKNPIHFKKLKKILLNADGNYFQRAEDFLNRYLKILNADEKNIDFSVSCYLQMVADTQAETVEFMRTGRYTSSSFAEVDKRVYGNPKIMESYLHGIVLSQFLWKHHYSMLNYFIDTVKSYRNPVNYYLEVGGGHGLYISEAVSAFGAGVSYDLVDVSPSSLQMARRLNNHSNINYILSDILLYESGKTFDFITMGEVLEHVEQPLKLLNRLYELLNNSGRIFITVPTNAPMIDHIYLFRNADEIRSLLYEANFEIESEICDYAEDVSAEMLEQNKVTMMYGALLRKRRL